MERPEFANIQTAAELFGTSRFTIWRFIKDGKIDVYQSEADRREKLIRLDDLERLIRPRLVESEKRLAA